MKSPGLKGLGLKLGLKFGVKMSKVEMSFKLIVRGHFNPRLGVETSGV